MTIDALYAAFLSLRTEASAGVDGVAYKEYDVKAWEKIPVLHRKLKSGEYRAQPLRRIYIPKEDGRQRPISIPSLEDKIVQRATVKLLNAIYEQDFLECSYGRSAQDALDEIGKVICRRPISIVLEADMCSYFDNIVRSQLMEMIEKRVSDGSILRLIRKWINVGVIGGDPPRYGDPKLGTKPETADTDKVTLPRCVISPTRRTCAGRIPSKTGRGWS